MHSQRMASIVPIVIGCIYNLAYGTIFTRAMFLPKIKLDDLFSARKAVDACQEVVTIKSQCRVGTRKRPKKTIQQDKQT